MSSAEQKICQNCEKQFTLQADDFSFYEKMGVPPPNLCPDCRLQRKLIWRNEHTFYKRTCDLCGKSIITIFHPRYSSPVYCFNCHYSDKWDPYVYGTVYNPERPFFEQFGKLLSRVPKATTHVGTGGSMNVNSEYVNFAGGNKNGYLLFNSAENEDCSYCRGIIKSRNSIDMYFAGQAESCYEGVNVNRSNKVLWSQNTADSLNSYFLLNCLDVQNCFGCVNLRHKSYHFFNEPLSKEEWEKRVAEIRGSHQRIESTRRKFNEFSLKFPRKENNNLKSVNCFGDYIFESKNCVDCFETFLSEDCKHAYFIKLLKDAQDIVGRGYQSELLLETVAVGHGCSRVMGSWSVEGSHDVEYSFDLRACTHCFGCVGLKHADYCILNKKYEEKEYYKIHEQIIKELKEKNLYGSYFPIELSPWAYNETLAQENYPLTKEQSLAEGFRWEEEIPRTKGQETLKAEQIPDHINDVKDDILNEILVCINCGYNYRLVKPELEFYRRMLIPIPRKCFNCRYLERISLRGPMRLYSRKCVKCSKLIQTTYAPDRPEIVYCEACYNSDII